MKIGATYVRYSDIAFRGISILIPFLPPLREIALRPPRFANLRNSTRSLSLSPVSLFSNAFHFLHGRTGGGRNAVHQQIQINGLITAAGKNDVCPSRNGYPPSLQCSTKRQSPGLVNFVAALAYHFCLDLPAAFTQPGGSPFI